MHWSCLPLVLLLLSFVGGCVCKDVAVIGVMTEISMEPSCKKINPNSVKLLEAVYWLIDNLPESLKQNLEFEIEPLDSCGKHAAVPETLKLINKYKNGTKKLIGIVTSSTSKKAIMISQFINSLPAAYHIIQIGVTETAFELNNRVKYKNLFRILPDDRTQMKMICDALVQMKWNYIALLHENDVYGQQGAELFAKCAKEANIHIGVTLEISRENLDKVKFDFKISGLVIIAHSSTVKDFFGVNRFNRKMSLLLTETTNINSKSFQIYIDGALLVVQKPFIKNQKFEDHWRDIFNQTLPNTTANPYFPKMIEEVGQCSFNDANHSCDMNKTLKRTNSKISQFETAESIATGVYAMAAILGPLSSCSPPSSCETLYKDGLRDLRKNTSYSFLKKTLGYERMDFRGAFDANGTLERPSNWVLYDLFYRIKNDGDKYSFHKAGTYTNSGLRLNRVIIPAYDKNDKESQVERITCPLGFNCKEHQKTPDYIYIEGDIMFIGIIPVHDRHISDPYSCGGIRSVSGISLGEAMLFAVKELNERHTYKYIFPGKKIGILILDSCDSDIIIVKKLFALRRNDPSICGRDFNCPQIIDKVMVYIGALSSRVSHAVSKIMTPQHTVQISYGSTSDTLSDRIKYPTFMRICTSDDQQVKAMIDLLVKFGWKYVSIIYANEMYGISFKDSFIDKSKVNDICVIRTLPYDAKANTDKMLTLVRQRPEAKVIILYLRSNQVEPFLIKFLESMAEGEFIFIGSEAWADKINLGETAAKVHGSFTLGLEIQENSDFNSYKKERILKENSMDILLEKYMEKSCYLPLSLDKRSNEPCPQNYTLDKAGMKSTWIPFVIDALTAAAIGLNKSISEICKNGIVCPPMFKKTKQVIENIKNTRLKKTKGNFKVFDENGDGTSSYNIFKVGTGGTYAKVGQWSKMNRISFNTGFQKPSLTTKCPNKKHCSECIYGDTVVPIPREEVQSYIAVLVIFFLLVLVLLIITMIFFYKRHKNAGADIEPYDNPTFMRRSMDVQVSDESLSQENAGVDTKSYDNPTFMGTPMDVDVLDETSSQTRASVEVDPYSYLDSFRRKAAERELDKNDTKRPMVSDDGYLQSGVHSQRQTNGNASEYSERQTDEENLGYESDTSVKHSYSEGCARRQTNGNASEYSKRQTDGEALEYENHTSVKQKATEEGDIYSEGYARRTSDKKESDERDTIQPDVSDSETPYSVGYGRRQTGSNESDEKYATIKEDVIDEEQSYAVSYLRSPDHPEETLPKTIDE